MGGIHISAEGLAVLDELVATYHRLGNYRPTAVAVIEDITTQSVLFVHSPKGDSWGFPQGGVERGESVAEAILREVEEEVGIPEEELAVRFCCHTQALDIPGRMRDGFTCGKFYLYFYLHWAGITPIRYAPEEVDSHQWLPRASLEKQICALCATTAKRASMIAAVRYLLAGA